jgi:hypothetical protein
MLILPTRTGHQLCEAVEGRARHRAGGQLGPCKLRRLGRPDRQPLWRRGRLPCLRGARMPSPFVRCAISCERNGRSACASGVLAVPLIRARNSLRQISLGFRTGSRPRVKTRGACRIWARVRGEASV